MFSKTTGVTDVDVKQTVPRCQGAVLGTESGMID